MMRKRITNKLFARIRDARGFTLTEMLATVLILVLASTLLARGIPVAIDTYKKTVKSSNAQLALSTTATKLRYELGMANVEKVESNVVYYCDSNDIEVTIQNSTDPTTRRGLEKQYYTGGGFAEENKDGSPILLVSNEAITSDLRVTFDAVVNEEDPNGGKVLTFTNLAVKDNAGNSLASIASYKVMTRFSS